MKKTKLKFGVIGSGSWGTALIKILSENNDEINWYIRNRPPQQIFRVIY